MTVFEKNTNIRTVFLGILLCALLVLLFQISDAVVKIEQDAHSISGETVSLLASAKDFVPKQSIDVAKINEVVSSVQSATDAAKTRINETGPTITAATKLVEKLGVSADKVNAPCPPKDSDKLHPCGTLADVAKTLNSGRGTLVVAEKGIYNFDGHEDELFTQEKATWLKTDVAVEAFGDSTKQLDGILKDGKEEADKLVHPAKKKLTFWGAVLATGQTIQKLSPPLF